MVNLHLVQSQWASSSQNRIYYIPIFFPSSQTYQSYAFPPFFLQNHMSFIISGRQNLRYTSEENKSNVQSCKQEEEKEKRREEQKDLTYSPNKNISEAKGKIYRKDENRNVVPNTYIHAFSFLEKKYKSQSKLKRVLSLYNLEQVCSIQKYYTYQKLLKSKLSNFRTQAAIAQLFELVDPSFQIFTYLEQVAFIKINGILLSNYLHSQENVCRILCSCKSKSDKRQAYLSANRKVEEIIKKHIMESRDKFSLQISRTE